MRYLNQLVYEILEKLVSIDTRVPPGNEKSAAIYLQALFEEHGIKCTLQDLGNNRANLIAQLGNHQGKSLLFNGHLDVVPAAEGWSYSPFSLTKSGDSLYGRGTSDMKGGIAAMSAAAILLSKEAKELNGELKLLFVADEECSNLGTHAYLQNYAPSDYAIIGEPTELNIAVAHRGVSRDYIDIHGSSAHAALPAYQNNAILDASKAVMAIEGLNEKLKKQVHEILPPPSVAVTMLQGYEKDNVIPGNVRLLTDFRILPGTEHQKVHQFLSKELEKSGVTNYTISQHFFMPGGETNPESAFVHTCCETAGHLFGKDFKPKPFHASCEQCLFEEKGIQSIICGPGSLEQAHTENEFLKEEQLYQAVNFYIEIAKEILQ